MAFELKLKFAEQDLQCKNITIVDDTDWTIIPDPAFTNRDDYGVFVYGVQQLASSTLEHPVESVTPIDDCVWRTPILTDGKYDFIAYAFLTLHNSTNPAVEDVAYDVASDRLVEWDGTRWTPIELKDALEKAYIEGSLLSIPMLMYAQNYRDRLNLEYIRIFRDDYINGATQNKLYYKRGTLDYCTALIKGAEYAWAIGTVTPYINMVESLNEMRLTDKTA